MLNNRDNTLKLAALFNGALKITFSVNFSIVVEYFHIFFKFFDFTSGYNKCRILVVLFCHSKSLSKASLRRANRHVSITQLTVGKDITICESLSLNLDSPLIHLKSEFLATRLLKIYSYT